MREFINKHPRWYWFIVVSVAVLAFTIVTCIGCGKLEKAHAGQETVKCTWKGEEVSIPLGDYPYYVLIKDAGVYGDALLLSKEKLKIEIRSDSWPLCLYDDDGNQTTAYGRCVKVYGYFNSSASSYVETQSTEYGVTLTNGLPSADKVVSNYDILNAKTGEIVYEGVSYEQYSLEAPYINFQSVVINNRIAKGDSELGLFESMYETYTKNSTWKYMGKLNNVNEALDREYQLEVDFLLKIPTTDYVIGLYEENGVDYTRESAIMKKTPELVRYWYNDKKAPYLEYEFTYVFPLVLDSNGNFTYSLTFDEILNLVKYFNPEALEAFQTYSEDFTAWYMAYMHIETVTACVKTTRDDCVVYGKVTTNQFERGIYDVCLEVIPEIDINTATPEDIDKILSDAMEKAHDQYIKDLEERVDQLETEMNNATGSLGSFDSEFSGNGLWGAIKGLGNGLLNMTGFLAAVAGIFGSVFGFLPYDVQQIVGYFLIISLLVALWKLIKG